MGTGVTILICSPEETATELRRSQPDPEDHVLTIGLVDVGMTPFNADFKNVLLCEHLAKIFKKEIWIYVVKLSSVSTT